MKKIVQILALALFVTFGCTPKNQPGGTETGVTLQLTISKAGAMPARLGAVVSGSGYSKPVSFRDLNQDRVLVATLPLPALSDGETVPVYVQDDAGIIYSAALPFNKSQNLIEGFLPEATTFVAGNGKQENPYFIAGAAQMRQLMQLYQGSQPADNTSFKYWFCLLEDVDVSKIAWKPLNNAGNFYKAIDFDGKGHTITGLSCAETYASFAGVLYGSIRNVSFDKASISGNTKKGVVAGFLGTTGLPGSCENVHVYGSTVSGGNYSGGFAGQIRTTGEITGCSVTNTTVSSTNSIVGGFASVLDIAGDDKYEVPARLSDCHVTDVTVNQQGASATLYTGGFIGASAQSGTFRDCTVKASVNASGSTLQNVGGFVGSTYYAGSNFHSCIVMPGTLINASGPNVGGFVGYSQTADIYNLCSVSSAVSGGSYVGGFAGLTSGSATFKDCSVRGTVTGQSKAGGFAGGADNSAFLACDANVTLSVNQSAAGGFVGEAAAASMRYCYTVLSYSGSNPLAGSFIGDSVSDKLSVSYCIGWHPSLPFSGRVVSASSYEYVYSGTSGTVSSQASASGWPAASWDFSGSYPVKKEGVRIINAVFVGDSITWQWGRIEGEYSKTNYPLKIPFNSAYMVDNGSTVTVKFHPGFFSSNGYLDKGISGQNTSQMKSRFKKDVLDVNPVAVVIMAGTNDLAQGVTKADIVANIASMAADASAAGIKVVLCSVTPNNSSYSKLSNPNTKGAHIIALNDMIKSLCTEKGYRYCDYWSSLVDTDGLSLKVAYQLYDTLHPGPDGYDVMEPIIKGILNSI